MIIAMKAPGRRGVWLRESPTVRGIETTGDVEDAKRDFADQAAINTYVTARGGSAGDFLAVTIP